MGVLIGSLIGLLLGAFIASYLVYAFLHWAVFKRFMADRMSSRVGAAVATYPACVVLYGFGAADNGSFLIDGFVIYILPTLIVFAVAYKTGRGEREQQMVALA